MAGVDGIHFTVFDVHMDTATSRTAIAVEAAIAAAEQTTLGVSQETGIPRTTLIRRLKGQSPFTVAELEAIANVLDTTIVALLNENVA